MTRRRATKLLSQLDPALLDEPDAELRFVVDAFRQQVTVEWPQGSSEWMWLYHGCWQAPAEVLAADPLPFGTPLARDAESR